MYRTLLFFFFSTSIFASDVKNSIDRVYQGYTTKPESVAVLASLEAGMPYSDDLDNARIMAFKCLFLDTDTIDKRRAFKVFLTEAKDIIRSSGDKVLLQGLSVCEAFQFYSQGLYEHAQMILQPTAEVALNPELDDKSQASVIGFANLVLSRVYLAKGQYKLAFDTAQKSYQAYELAENYYERALTLREIAAIHAALFNYDLAIEQLLRAKAELAKFNVQEHYKVTDEIAYVYELKGEVNKAIELYLSIFSAVRQYENDDGFGYLAIKVAQLYTQLNELEKAQQYFSQVQKLDITSDWITLLYTLARAQWFLATEQIANAVRENNVLTQLDQQNWPVSFTKRYLQFYANLAKRQGDYQTQATVQKQLLAIANTQVNNVADRALLSERLMFNLNQQNREIARLQEVADFKEKLLDIAVDKAFWQRLTLVFACVMLLTLCVYAYKQVQHKQHYKVLALKDELTGVANRRAILDKNKRAICKSKITGTTNSLISIDIDHFKAVNDQYGHDIGDELIKSVVNTISKGVRSSDSVGRVGGEEFLIVLEQQSLQHALEVAERIRSAIALQTHTVKNIKATVSMGVVEVAPDESPKQAAKRADVNLYAAKRSGRNIIIA
ncbi:MAG: diguanylate cyclase [Pseudoalteromonas sp.]